MVPARILVVDDEVELERLIRQRFRKQIKAKELDFLFAADGKQALNCLQADHQVDIVLTDINMPEMDGLTLLSHLSSINHSLRAVVMSAYSDLSNIRQAMNRGAFDFLTKPIDFQDLEITIRKTLEAVQQLRERQQHLDQIQQDLVHAAYHDPLTGLPNRSWFHERLTQLLQQADEPIHAVLFIDLDGFKQVNDSLGHNVGDALLQCIAQRLRGCLRQRDRVARLGGDEFAVLLESLENPLEATAVAHRIQAQLKQPFQIQGSEILAGASIGIAFSQTDGQQYQQPEDFLRDADMAMYAAKANGKGRFEVFRTDINNRSASSDGSTPH